MAQAGPTLPHTPEPRLDAASAILTTAMLAPIFARLDRGAAGAVSRTTPAKPAPAARAMVLA
jgi:hypothetical protein